MKRVLVTGGTVFVSRYIAEYYVCKNWDVYVLNRNTKIQSEGVTLIEADRRNLGDVLKSYHFDVVFDVTAYNANDVDCLLNALGGFDDYILISSSSVYPEYCKQPFTENTPIGENKIWGNYGMGKVEAERALQARVPGAYILRPPYLYGPMNNVYREAFAFDCALGERKFYIPKDGDLRLQFFHVKDLCRFMDVLIEKHPEQKIFNVGNEKTVTVKEWIETCYKVVGKRPEFVKVYQDIEQRNYFSFYDYDYCLDISKQKKFMSTTESIEVGLREALEWYLEHPDRVNKKPYIAYIDNNLACIK
ncbi:MAG: NAD-dependent epimerase/dehydratase family protein [Butyrivibrio sp.]|nr:NAD-dependent epimerase/dehydratase family protein [Butyrivibrio sp.]